MGMSYIRVCCARCEATWGTPSDRRWPCGCGGGELVCLGTWEPSPGHWTLAQLWERNRLRYEDGLFGTAMWANAGPCLVR